MLSIDIDKTALFLRVYPFQVSGIKLHLLWHLNYTVSQQTSPTFSTVTWKPIIRFW